MDGIEDLGLSGLLPATMSELMLGRGLKTPVLVLPVMLD